MEIKNILLNDFSKLNIPLEEKDVYFYEAIKCNNLPLIIYLANLGAKLPINFFKDNNLEINYKNYNKIWSKLTKCKPVLDYLNIPVSYGAILYTKTDNKINVLVVKRRIPYIFIGFIKGIWNISNTNITGGINSIDGKISGKIDNSIVIGMEKLSLNNSIDNSIQNVLEETAKYLYFIKQLYKAKYSNNIKSAKQLIGYLNQVFSTGYTYRKFFLRKEQEELIEKYYPILEDIINTKYKNIRLKSEEIIKLSDNWSFPRGGINVEETINACIVREVYEETGISLNGFDTRLISNEFFNLNFIGLDDKPYINHFLVFECNNMIPCKVKDIKEIIECKWVSLDKIKELLNLDSNLEVILKEFLNKYNK